MINSIDIINFFKSKKVEFYVGVPDSILSSFLNELDNNLLNETHIIAANEGNAFAIAMGNYMATKKPSIIYLQNSGLGNITNPLISLADKEVYSIPSFMIIGWRGKPNYKDEPQHIKQGRITSQMLDIMEIPFKTLEKKTDVIHVLNKLWNKMVLESRPVALLIPNDILEIIPKDKNNIKDTNNFDYREKIIKEMINFSNKKDVFIATTGKTGRELFEIRDQLFLPKDDFLTVGGMGHASSIALGIALAKPNKRIFCIDGDGALIMHMGVLTTIGKSSPKNLFHILLNNFSHESVGGQPTGAEDIDFEMLSKSCNYNTYSFAKNSKEFLVNLKNIENIDGPHFIEVCIKNGSRKDLGRPTLSPKENKNNLMKKLSID